LRQWRNDLIKAGLVSASVNKIAKSAMAAFNLTARLDARIAANAQAWHVGLEMLPNSVVSRDAVLTETQVKAIVSAAREVNAAFGLFVQAHAETGSRSSQLARCVVADLTGDKLMVPASRKGRNGGRGGHVGVPLTAGLAERLKAAAVGRAPEARLFVQADGESWREGDHKRPFAAAARLAGLPEATIYALRHSSIARLLLRGLPIRLVAEIHDTSTSIIEKHYGRFVARHGDDMLRAALLDTSPVEPPNNVTPLRHQ
jgi:integrase